MTTRKMTILMIACMCPAVGAYTQQGSGRFSFSAGLLYKNGLNVTLAYEYEMSYRHVWEFSANGYLRQAKCESRKHVCPKPFWRNYRIYGFGVAYKPYVTGGRNHYGSLRIGASDGSDTKKLLAGLHFGYEYNYVLRAGWALYWQVKGDVVIKGTDVPRTGVALGIKLSIK